MTWKPEHQNEIAFLKRRIRVDNFGWHVVLNQRCVKSLLDAMAMNHCESMATPDRRDRRAVRMWQIRLKNWIHKNIESSDQVLESVSI